MFMISMPIAQDSQMKHKPAHWANITFAINTQNCGIATAFH